MLVPRLLAALLIAGVLPARAPAQRVSPLDSAGWHPRDVPWPARITLDVDASDVERGIFHVSESMPVTRAGRLTLLFPTWVPGNHAPTARIERLAGLLMRAGGKRLPWVRDPVDMHAFHVDVPAGAHTIDVEFDYLSGTRAADGRVVMTPEMLNLQWFSLVLHPAGYYARRITVEPRVKIPDGWHDQARPEHARPRADGDDRLPARLAVPATGARRHDSRSARRAAAQSRRGAVTFVVRPARRRSSVRLVCPTAAR